MLFRIPIGFTCKGSTSKVACKEAQRDPVPGVAGETVRPHAVKEGAAARSTRGLTYASFLYASRTFSVPYFAGNLACRMYQTVNKVDLPGQQPGNQNWSHHGATFFASCPNSSTVGGDGGSVGTPISGGSPSFGGAIMLTSDCSGTRLDDCTLDANVAINGVGGDLAILAAPSSVGR